MATLRANNSFKPSPLRGLGAKPALLGRAVLIQALAAHRSNIVKSRLAVALALLPFALTACNTVRTNACPSGSKPAAQELIYFGTQTPSGQVTPEQWTAFVDQVVTPKLPNGFTTWSASGQWQSATSGIVKEPSYVLSLVHQPGQAQGAAVDQIIAAYKSKFQQEAVLRVTSNACMGL